jgi:hypothetical protein
MRVMTENIGTKTALVPPRPNVTDRANIATIVISSTASPSCGSQSRGYFVISSFRINRAMRSRVKRIGPALTPNTCRHRSILQVQDRSRASFRLGVRFQGERVADTE